MAPLPASSIRLRVFSKEEDVPEAKRALKYLLPDAEIQTETLSAEEDGGVFLTELTVLIAKTTRQRDVKKFITLLTENLDRKERKHLREDAENRLDEEGNFFLRLNVKEASEGRLVLSETGLHVKIKVRAFPKSKAPQMVTEWLQTEVACQR
ncbi:RNA-binding protein [uncultured archaeon]|nr:RNA-binding protein [uncultured archaeon]